MVNVFYQLILALLSSRQKSGFLLVMNWAVVSSGKVPLSQSRVGTVVQTEVTKSKGLILGAQGCAQAFANLLQTNAVQCFNVSVQKKDNTNKTFIRKGLGQL